MLPTPPANFIPHLQRRLEAGSNVLDIVAPFKEYEGKLRELYAQEPDSPVLATPQLNLVPLYDGHEGLLSTRSRDLDNESPQEKDRYIFSLDAESRRAHGSPAVVQSLKQFNRNFTIFAEQSLAELDWNNVVAAGSSVLTPLLPVPEKHNATKRDLRNYYHDQLAPASDVDLFLYGLNEAQAIEKIKQIESCVRNSILEETTCVRTKNTITIVSKYPVRHVQIVLRLYSSISEILAGFDVDSACVAYDGSQVWATPRAVAAMVTQINTVDLTRRSPSYENRLAKYHRRGFEVYWPDLDRSKIDPTIFERSFSSVVGLARLLVMEKLPNPADRENYLTVRLSERGARDRYKSHRHHRWPGGQKNLDPQDIAEWAEAEDASNYHTCTIPYGPDYHARKIEKLLYRKDMLLNAEWNKPKDRDVHLHRHPAFFGRVASIISDCCGACPQPLTDEEAKVAEEESKWFISGDLKFVKDNPGRQAIGSFNPITDGDWTEMAYLSDSARLCQAIVDDDVAYIQRWCDQKGNAEKIDNRDHTGRTPLHLAIICGNLEIVKCLIDHGARIVSRVEGGFTALHIAAHRGHAGIVEALIHKSEENKKLAEEAGEAPEVVMEMSDNDKGDDPEEEMEESGSEESFLVSDGDTDMRYATTDASFVNIEVVKEPDAKEDPEEGESNDPDIYDINVVAWDVPVSPLHLAIMHGHEDIIDIFASTFGADIQLPVWLRDSEDGKHTAVLPISLSLGLPPAQSRSVCKALLELGVSSAQADTSYLTALHSVVAGGSSEILDLLFDLDGAAAKCALDHPAINAELYAEVDVQTPITTAVRRGDAEMVRKLLQYGANCSIAPESFEHLAAKSEVVYGGAGDVKPVIMSVFCNRPDLTRLLIDSGADPNALETGAERVVKTKDRCFSPQRYRSLLDLVAECISVLDFKFTTIQDGHDYLAEFPQGSYARWLCESELEAARIAVDNLHQMNEKYKKQRYGDNLEGDEYTARIQDARASYDKLYEFLKSKGAKTFDELHPELANDSNLYRPPVFEFSLGFSTLDKRDFVAEQHKNLFEAAWNGDSDTVKALTTSPWGRSNERPLHVSVRDNQGFTPFDIAVLRGNTAMVKLIADIANSQYAPRKERRRPDLGVDSSGESDDDDCGSAHGSGDESDSGSEPDVERTTVDVREVQNMVPSRTRPFDLLRSKTRFWKYLDNSSSFMHEFMKCTSTGPFDPSDVNTAYSDLLRNVRDNYLPENKNWTALRYAIEKGDNELAITLLELGVKYSPSRNDSTDDGQPAPEFGVSTEEFEAALRHGRIDVLSAMISKTGFGLPLRKLMDRTGVKVEQKAERYQGLSVDGKKRHDWAERGVYDGNTDGEALAAAPILQPVCLGNLETVKWYLGDEPRKQYAKYAKTQTPASTHDNIEGIITSWWNTNRKHAVYSAIISNPTAENDIARLKLVLDEMPHALNLQEWHGQTPLHVAFSLRRVSAAKYLIDRGADQTLRDEDGANILHTLLAGRTRNDLPPDSNDHNVRSGKYLQSVTSLNAMCDLIDPGLIPVLANQRMRGEADDELPTFHTPLAAWLDVCCATNDNIYNHNLHTDSDTSESVEDIRMLREILRRTNAAGLRTLDGRADLPIHSTIRASHLTLAAELLNHDAQVLDWENGTGNTGLDILDRGYQREIAEFWAPFIDSISSVKSTRRYLGRGGLAGRLEARREMRGDGLRRTGKRKLVSVVEANELVRRLETFLALKREREEEEKKKKEDDEEEEEEEGGSQPEEVLQELFNVVDDGDGPDAVMSG